MLTLKTPSVLLIRVSIHPSLDGYCMVYVSETLSGGRTPSAVIKPGRLHGKPARVASPSGPQIPPLKGLAFLVVVLGRRHPTPGARCYPPLTPSRAGPPWRRGPGRGAAAAVDSDTAGFPRPPPGSSRLLRASGARPLPTSPKERGRGSLPVRTAYARRLSFCTGGLDCI